MNHCFNTDIAGEVGIIPAVLLENIAHWVRLNKANNDNFYDGDYWIFSSVSAWSELFTYLSKDQIRRGLDKLIECGFIKSGNYNKSTYDRTKWYSLTEKAWSFYGEKTQNAVGETANSNRQNNQIHFANLPNGSGKKAEPIPDIEVNIEKNIEGNIGYTPLYPPKGGVSPNKKTVKPDKSKPVEQKFDPVYALIDVGVEKSIARDYLKTRKKPFTETALKFLLRECEKAGVLPNEALEMAVGNGWQGFQAVYLQNRKPDSKKSIAEINAEREREFYRRRGTDITPTPAQIGGIVL